MSFASLICHLAGKKGAGQHAGACAGEGDPAEYKDDEGDAGNTAVGRSAPHLDRSGTGLVSTQLSRSEYSNY